jgi:hypothetical protein
MNFVTFLEALLTFLVVFAQFKSFVLTRHHALALARLFPDYQPIAEVEAATSSVSGTSEKPVDQTQLRSAGSISTGFRNILDSTNLYLEKNAGTPADFRILQDIAERGSNSLEQAATANATLPLYIGLMGTFIGVIVGLLSFVIGGISSATDLNAFADPGHLQHFVGGVLIAMSGSLCGLLLTVYGRVSFLNDAQRQNDQKKQLYFTLLQTELLPVVGHDFSSALYGLQKNLHRFNSDFSANLSTFAASMGTATETLRLQRDLLDVLRSANLVKIIKANAEMLTRSESISKTLRDLAETLATVQESFLTTGQLADRVNSLLDRFGTFERSINGLGEKIAIDQTVTISTVQLIREQLDSLKSRGDLIRQFVDSQDDEIRLYIEAQRQRLSDLTTNAKQQLAELTDEIARSVAEALSGGQISSFVEQIGHLKGIDEKTQVIGLLLEKLELSTSQTETSILQALKDLPNGLTIDMTDQISCLKSIDGQVRQVATALGNPQNPNTSLDAEMLRVLKEIAAKKTNGDGRVGPFGIRLPGWLGGKDSDQEGRND